MSRISILRGSSPLARGLRDILSRLVSRPGIIPARAGFTSYSERPRARYGDHPRSRGVYRARSGTSSPVKGSSPLARGLPAPSAIWTAPTRIIPARAGFTSARRSRGRSPADHPRSRGVYQRRLSLGACRIGSSPLARGLRGADGTGRCSSGIIPARAGFTRAQK